MRVPRVAHTSQRTVVTRRWTRGLTPSRVSRGPGGRRTRTRAVRPVVTIIGQTDGVFLLRVALPDRPGSLGAVATALGAVQADINAVAIVEKADGFAVDDFHIGLPQGAQPDALVSACTSIEGVEVLWMSFWPGDWGLQADVGVLNDMTEHPQAAARTLTEQAPAVFHAHWAVQLRTDDGRVLTRTDYAPEEPELPMAVLGDLRGPRTAELAEDWLPGWPETWVATAPFRDGSVILIARKGGPEFLASELARLRHLAALAQ